MPATVETDPPGIWCMFSDGSTIRFSLDGLPCPGLAGDLLTGLAGLVHPHGRIDAAGTAGIYVRAFREMTRTLAAAGFTGRAADLRRPAAHGSRRLGASGQGRAGQAGWAEMITWSGS